MPWIEHISWNSARPSWTTGIIWQSLKKKKNDNSNNFIPPTEIGHFLLEPRFIIGFAPSCTSFVPHTHHNQSKYICQAKVQDLSFCPPLMLTCCQCLVGHRRGWAGHMSTHRGSSVQVLLNPKSCGLAARLFFFLNFFSIPKLKKIVLREKHPLFLFVFFLKGRQKAHNVRAEFRNLNIAGK